MAWPPDVADGQIITASHINSIRNAISVWGGPVNAAGNSLTGVSIAGFGTAAPIRLVHLAGPNFVELVIEATGQADTLAAGRVWGISNVNGSLNFRNLNAAGSAGSPAWISLTPAGLITIGNAWNGGHFVLGTYHLWVDAGGKLRIKSSVPAGDTDGTVVGTQT